MGRVARYSCWCPKAIATIGPLHPTLASRCIVVRMQRKMGEEECERLKRLDATELRRKCARFVADGAGAGAQSDWVIAAGYIPGVHFGQAGPGVQPGVGGGVAAERGPAVAGAK